MKYLLPVYLVWIRYFRDVKVNIVHSGVLRYL